MRSLLLSAMLLLDPDPAGNGTGGSPPGQPPPAQEPPKPETVTIPKSELEGLFAAKLKFEQFQADYDARVKSEADKTLAAAAKDKEDAVKAVRTEADREKAALTQSWLGAELQRDVSAALAGVDFASPAAATQALQLLAGEVEAVLADGKPVVRVKATGLPATEHLKARLGSPEFAHFLKAKTQGGAQPPAPGQPPQGGNGQVDLNEAGYQAMRGMQFGPRLAFPK